jgi:hypothetical protein
VSPKGWFSCLRSHDLLLESPWLNAKGADELESRRMHEGLAAIQPGRYTGKDILSSSLALRACVGYTRGESETTALESEVREASR